MLSCQAVDICIYMLPSDSLRPRFTAASVLCALTGSRPHSQNPAPPHGRHPLMHWRSVWTPPLCIGDVVSSSHLDTSPYSDPSRTSSQTRSQLNLGRSPSLSWDNGCDPGYPPSPLTGTDSIQTPCCSASLWICILLTAECRSFLGPAVL